MIKEVTFFTLKLVLFIAVGFSIHIGVLDYLEKPVLDHFIIPSYFTNIVLALFIFISLVKLKEKQNHLLGFVFMAGSFLKFGAYFIFFNPLYKENGNVSNIEATTFMIPYLMCLFFETTYVIKMLNKEG
ncbi:hypothetical protein [Lutibacter sp.]|uniref:hypothetical protein n=1 Tax=Lutibacter sp. TaxID=1925666 RepID=UPI002732E6DB|nr:hypothetical protein [Lutibacter sp.]MDP3313182.1 hypothetical protein [Lutibacter sp.]